ncbi:hypothetical protein [Massilia sp. S19_KUP03_FR1]|uniref:hypothetical protein n=1 Tax=Massilia sp. S19_KUP03_FR1 TaxID=3025503 RepID=UPI002FCDC851
MSVDTLREAFHINRVTPDKIQDFLTAQTYRPEITKAKEKIKTQPWVFLQSVCKRPIRQGKSPSYSDDAGLLCIKPKNTNEMIVSLEELSYIQPASKDEVAGQRLQKDDIVITRSGSGTIGRASIFLSDEEVYTNDHLFIVRTDAVDSHYTCAFLNTYWGQRVLEAGISGSTGQLNLSNEHIKGITLYTPAELAQKYIGDKIRQAERLRAWANTLNIILDAHFSGLVKNPLSPRVSWVAKKEDLDPYRINPKQYDPVVLDLIQRAEADGTRLEPLSSLVGVRQIAGGATPKGAQYFDKGILFARVQNVKPLRLDLSDAVYIDQLADEELARSRCAADDIIFTITGYPGTAALVTEEDIPVNINQHSVRFNIKDGIESGYVCAALNSRFLKYQVDRLAIGGTRDALDYPSVGRLLIPRYEAEVEKTIGDQARYVNAAVKLSQRLTNAAKLLVEALIEGQLTEAELIAAEQALQAGNDQLDRRVLNRLRTDRVDGQGPALFSDLDELYRFLSQAEVD